MIAAAPALADLASVLRENTLVETLATACGDLVHGFSAPPGSVTRVAAHHRAWVAVRQIDRGVQAARLGRRAPAATLRKAQRAVDRADVLVGALLPD